EGVVERLDLEVAERWISALGNDPRLTVAELMLALARDDIRAAVRIADQLEALGQRAAIARESDRAAALMAWSYLHACRIDDVRQIAEAAEPDVETVIRFGLRVV